MTAILLALLAPGCGGHATAPRPEPTFVEVTVEGATGSEEAPLPFSAEATSWTVHVETLDRNAEPYPFDGELVVRVRPGRLASDDRVTLSGGEWTGTVEIEAGFGPTRIWFADEDDADGTRTPTYATGVTDPLWFSLPTIAEMQRSDDIDTDQLEGEYAELRVADREVVVTWVGADGFWATDVTDATAAEPAPAYGSIFVYTFSQPDGVERGDRLAILQGSVQEYLATTQFSFPYYEASGERIDPPDYVAIDGETVCRDASMEALESAPVVAEGLTIPADFGKDESDDDYLDYVEYGQWPASFGRGCTLHVDSSALEDFDPVAHAGETLGAVRGMLQQVWGKWILVANSDSDIGGDGASTTARALRRPAPRARVRLSRSARDRALSRPEPPRSACTSPH